MRLDPLFDIRNAVKAPTTDAFTLNSRAYIKRLLGVIDAVTAELDAAEAETRYGVSFLRVEAIREAVRKHGNP